MNNPARWERVQALFHAALGLGETERPSYLAAQCADDPQLLADVQALLDADAAGAALAEPDLARLAHEVLDGSVPLLRRIGPYWIIRVLGQGGMGVVYLGKRDDLNSRVAIKVLRDASLSPARRERFQREEQTLAQLNHPSIARLYDADVLPDGTPYFVMEYVEGMPLNEYCTAHGCSISERLRLFQEICEAVQYAHRHAVVHRDLKPSNILVGGGEPGGDATVKLLDFGIAKQLESLETPAHQTQTGLRLMTPAYAAPEQLRGEPVGVYTDVYALGVILYELLTGRHPFEPAGTTPVQLEARIMESGPPRPSASARRSAASSSAAPTFPLSRGAWADLDVLCLTAMHPDVQRRYSTVEALLRDLQHFLAGQPLEARADTFRYRAGKFLRRNRQPVAVATMVAALLVALVTFYTAQLAEQRDRAQLEAAKAERISEYLIGLFEAGDPYGPEAENLDVRTLLERGEQRAAELEGNPAVKATMLNVLGRVYTQLSDYGRAEPLLQRALELRREHGDPLDVAASLTNLGILYRFTAQFDDAEAALREALAIRQRNLPPNHPDLPAVLDDLGAVLNSKGNYVDAEAVYRLALRMRREIHDQPHGLLAHTLNNLAVNQVDQGNYAAAERYLREALAVSMVAYGADHPYTAVDLANLGSVLEIQGNFAAADSMLSAAVRITRLRLGNDHYRTAFRLTQLGGTLRRKGDLDRAETVLQEALEIGERILGPDHRDIAITLNHLALTLQDQHDYAAAEPLFRRAIGTFALNVGERHPHTAIVRCHLAYLLHLRGHSADAEAHFREGLAILEEILPADHDMLALNQGSFGKLLSTQARFPEAEPLLTASYQALQAKFGDAHHYTRQAARRLIDLYEDWGKPEQADLYGLVALAGSESGGQR